MNKDKRVDEYIDRAAAFAQPILRRLRTIVHNASPQITETIKWGFPNFEYKGKILCAMAAFKQHCSFNLWLGSRMNLSNKSSKESPGMGIFGKITSLKDLPSDEEIVKLIQQAIVLTEEGKTIQRKAPAKNEKIITPKYLLEALKKDKAALKNYEAFSTSKKKEYVEWITEAKTEITRNKRLATAIEWIAEGKSRNWKYQK